MSCSETSVHLTSRQRQRGTTHQHPIVTLPLSNTNFGKLTSALIFGGMCDSGATFEIIMELRSVKLGKMYLLSIFYCSVQYITSFCIKYAWRLFKSITRFKVVAIWKLIGFLQTNLENQTQISSLSNYNLDLT